MFTPNFQISAKTSKALMEIEACRQLYQNLFEIAPTAVSETKALVTLFSGKAVHGDLSEL
jgi:hypothetical protein